MSKVQYHPIVQLDRADSNPIQIGVPPGVRPVVSPALLHGLGTGLFMTLLALGFGGGAAWVASLLGVFR